MSNDTIPQTIAAGQQDDLPTVNARTSTETPNVDLPGAGWTMVNGSLMKDGEAQAIFDAARDYRVGQMNADLAATPEYDTPSARASSAFVADSMKNIGSFTSGLNDVNTTMSPVPLIPGIDLNLAKGITFSGDFVTISEARDGGNGLGGKGLDNIGIGGALTIRG